MKLFDTIENIDVQDKSRFKKLESIFTEMVKVANTGKMTGYLHRIYSVQIEKELEDLFNMRSSVKINDDGPNASVIPAYLNKRHTLANVNLRKILEGRQFDQKEADEVLKKFRKGGIDISSGKLHGSFKEFNHIVKIGVKALIKVGLTAPELTAVLLHEIGHAFTYIESSNRTATMNHALRQLENESSNKVKRKKFIYELIKSDKREDKNLEKIKDIENTNNRVILDYKISKMVFDDIVSTDSSASAYSRTSSEFLADNYATRCGYGMELSLALSKLEKGNHISNSIIHVIAHFNLITALLVVLTLVTGGVVSPIGIAIVIVEWMKINGSTSSKDVNPYDNSKDRIQRILNEQRFRLTDKKLSKADKENLINEIESTALIQKAMWDYKNIYQIVGDIFYPSGRKARKEKDYQRQLEDLSSSRLLQSAIKLSLRN